MSHYYNFRGRTVAESLSEYGAKGWTGFWADRSMWNNMRMSDRDIPDVTGYTYTFLINGVPPADEQNIEPVTVDEMRLGVAEPYDVIVEPKDDRAYGIFARAINRTGYARGTLTPDLSRTADVPAMDPAPVFSHRDMGMGGQHGDHDTANMAQD